MNLANSKAPLILLAIGSVLIVGSFLWERYPLKSIDETQLTELMRAQEKGHEAVSKNPEIDGGARAVEKNAESKEALQAKRKRALEQLERAQFLRTTAPKYARYLGVFMAALGSILYPVQLLARQAQAQAEQAEANDATVVE